MPEPITSGPRSASAGNHGPDVRSDCRVTVWESATPGPPHWKLTSKVATLYGGSIRTEASAALAALVRRRPFDPDRRQRSTAFHAASAN